MRAWVCAGRWSAAAAAAMLLAGCEQPAWLKRDPLPPLPAWAAPLHGRPLAQVFSPAPDAACAGNVEQVEHRYGGEPRQGVRLSGWAWDVAGKAPPARILIVGPDGRIAGAGETGRARPDVAEAREDVTSAATGWGALTTLQAGEALAYGVLADGARVCKLGRIAL